MQIQSLRAYFTYSIPITNWLDLEREDDLGLGVGADLLECFKGSFDVVPAPVPAFYTAHYRNQHTPYRVSDPATPGGTFIPKEKLAAIPFFSGLNLKRDIRLTWELTAQLHNIGLITLCLHADEALSSTLAYRLGGLYLNPAYAVIATGPLKQLWSRNPAERPDFVTLDELARVIHTYFFTACGLPVYRYQALGYEMQIPFLAVDVETGCDTQAEFIEKEAENLAELVFRPACWEVGRTSNVHVRQVLGDARLWSVSRDALVFTSYEGCVLVHIKSFSIPPLGNISGFYLTSEASIFHTFQVGVGNYLFLRILDELLDERLSQLVEEVHHHQHTLNASDTDDDQPILRKLDDLTIHITYLRFRLLDLLEEISNSDKLIDEEYHIILLDKINNAMGIRAWFEGLNRRIGNLQQLVEAIEGTYERLSNLQNTRQIQRFEAQMLQINLDNQKLDERLSKAQPFFEALAAVEALTLFIYIWFDPGFPMISTLSVALGLPVGFPSRVLGTILVGGALFVIIKGIHWLAGYRASKKESAK
ncbi:MAG: hypothetical protein ACOYYS_18300 [Chloroflexota bacterium]